MRIYFAILLVEIIWSATFSTCAYADQAFAIGDEVTIIAPYFEDDGRVGHILSLNENLANVNYQKMIMTGNHVEIQKITDSWPLSKLHLTSPQDLVFHHDQKVRISKKGLREYGTVGTVKEFDGKLVFVQYETAPGVIAEGLWPKEAVSLASWRDYPAFPGDHVRVNLIGLPYSGVDLNVTYSNGNKVWFSYIDRAGRENVGVIPATNCVVIEKSFHADFETDALLETYRGLESLLYGPHQVFFTLIAQYFDADVATVDSRNFLNLALYEMMEDLDSDIIKRDVLPAYKSSITSFPDHSLNQIPYSSPMNKRAALVMRASIEVLLQVVGDPQEKASLTNIHSKIGKFLANSLDRPSLKEFLGALTTSDSLMDHLILDYQTKSFAITFKSALEYLRKAAL